MISRTNVRSGLFGLEKGVLVETAESYVPAGGIGDFLNTNIVFNFLSGYSNAFSLIKETATLALRKRMVAENVGEGGNEAQVFEAKLAAAIFERISRTTRTRRIPLVIQSIPVFNEEKSELADVFPLQEFDVSGPGRYYLSAKTALDPYVSKELLYWKRSHRHWTPLAHRLDAEALAALIASQRLLD